MSRYRKIDPKIWNDEKFRDFTDRGKLAFLFVLTHPAMTALGAMRHTIPGLAAEIGWPEKAFRDAISEAISKGMIEADEKASFIGAPKFLRYNKPESINCVKSWVAAYHELPECKLKLLTIQRVEAFAYDIGDDLMDAFRHAFADALAQPKAIPEHEQYPEHEQELPTCAPKPARLSVLIKSQQESFNKFWEKYRKKKSKGDAEKAWKTLNPDEELTKAIMEGLARALQSEDWSKDGGQFVPYPASWLHSRGWEDDPTPATTGESGRLYGLCPEAEETSRRNLEKTLAAMKGGGK